MPTQINPAQLKAMFDGQSLSLNYNEAVRYYWKLKVHADGDVPLWLIKKARPNESADVATYRQRIYEPETQNPIERVIGVFEKIHRSPDFMIRFKDDDVPAIIDADETPKQYLTQNYPLYDSIEYWLFEEALRYSALDANAVIAIMPPDLNEAQQAIDNNQYIQPVARIFNSCSVIQFKPQDYVVLRSDEFSSLLSPTDQQARARSMEAAYGNNSNIRYDTNGEIEIPLFQRGQVYYFINTISYQKWEETSEGKYQLTELFDHNLEELPAFQMPGKYVKRVGDAIVKKSLLYPMVPHLNKAARESNDLDAGVIMHLFLEKWRINNMECKTCNGTGKIIVNQAEAPCNRCEGTGMATGKSPFNEVLIKAAALGQQSIPVPPLGYVQKDSEILKIQSERIENHIYKALAAVNMEHLAKVQLNQSGVSKAYDRDEVNNLIYQFAENLIAILNKTIYFINELRYKGLITDPEKRKLLLPIIPVPEKFDVINTTFLLQEYQAGKTAGLNATILAEMQKEIAQKKFYANPGIADFVETVMALDPFPDKTIEEKSLMQGSGLANKTDVILSNYITDFVNQAMQKDKAFKNKTIEQKREVLLQMAKDKEQEMSTAKQITQDIFNSNPGGQPGGGQLGGGQPGTPARTQPMQPQAF